ncbi:MAG: AlpA family phage regulatory protein [Chromatiaceae bacterium]|nr:AlpA family phage regulatory protein [Chromatiaceae bacterium]MCP5316033.1 AlpA family phage regulatory protein [Chromatiaceae bacterium]
MKRLLPTKSVEDRVGRRKSWIYGEVDAGRFPLPVRPGLWLEAEVEQWIDEQIAKRDERGAA